MTSVAPGEAAAPRDLASALRHIQAPVRPRLERVVAHLERLAGSSTEAVAQDVARHVMQMRGKMVRPTLLLLASEVEGRQDSRAEEMAAIVELIHLSSLVHDDAVDHSALRRGLPTVNAAFSHQVAVIMGDYFYSRALLELSERREWDALAVLARASHELTLGEIRQLGAVQMLDFAEGDYERLIASKTAALFRAACDVGALVGAPAHRQALATFGERLGMAFQVADDLLDYVAFEDTTGKPHGLDLKEHKVTLPLIAALKTMGPAERAKVDTLFRSPEPTDADVADVVGIVAASGGLEYARRRGLEYALEAEAALRTVPDSPAKAALAETLGYVMDRRG
jgi:octaprenyl-diphosphate synthase